MSPTKKSRIKKAVRQTEVSDFVRDSSAQALRGLVDVSLNRSDGSIDSMLKFITDWFDGFGCILWQTTPSTDVNSKPLRGELFVLAEFLPENVRCAMHDLPMEGSWTGEVVSQNQAKKVPEFADGSGRLQNDHFIESSRLQSMISAPVHFDENTRGALNVYRQDDQPPFSSEDLKTLEDIASAVSHLYEANRERSGFQLLNQVNEIIREAEARPVMSLEDKRGYLRRICEVVGETFDALETSIYLAYRRDNTEEYRLQATTWEECVEVETYEPALNGSVTAWILAHGTPVKILNLPDFSDDSPKRNGEYPGLVWRRSEHFLQLVKELVGGDPRQQPPISFIGTPILSGEETLGVIRCCAAERSPFFFSAADLELLKLVAAQISQCWSSWMARCDLVEEVAEWQRVVNEMNELNRIVQSQFGDQNELMTSSLKAFSKGVDGADALAIRFWDGPRNDLYYKHTHGAFWRGCPFDC
jgi:GAF domain-containing protein